MPSRPKPIPWASVRRTAPGALQTDLTDTRARLADARLLKCSTQALYLGMLEKLRIVYGSNSYAFQSKIGYALLMRTIIASKLTKLWPFNQISSNCIFVVVVVVVVVMPSSRQ